MPRPRKIRIISSDEDDEPTATAATETTSTSKAGGSEPPASRRLTRATRSTSASKPKATLNSSTRASTAAVAAPIAQNIAASPKSKKSPRSKTATIISPRINARASSSQPSKPISSFFSKAGQPAKVTKRPTSSQLSQQLNENEAIDNIESSSDDETARRNRRRVVVPIISSEPDELPRKLPAPLAKASHAVRPSKADSQRQLALEGPAESQPWADRHTPASTADLAVHKRKIEDVKNWLVDVFTGHSPKRLLVLSGPSGSGKTATVTTLAREMDFDILTWDNPSQHGAGLGGDEVFESLNTKFEEFMGRGTGYGALPLATSANTDALAKQPMPSQRDPNRRQVILLEDLPNIFSSSSGAGSSAMMSFRGAVHSFLATPQDDVLPSPCILIISENLTTQSNSSSITPHRLLGPQLLNHRRTKAIQFNKIAPTIMQKALEKIIDVEARRTGVAEKPSAALIAGVGACGDIRSAINTLEFMMVGNSSAGFRRQASASGARKRKTGGTQNRGVPSESEKLTLELITQRESSLGIFHAVGKVVWNKRLIPDTTESRVSPPEILPDPVATHLSSFARPPSLVDIASLIDTAGVDLDVFVSGIHENYLPSCAGPLFTENFEACIEHLSDADMLSQAVSPGGRNQVEDNMRQGELAFQVAVRGTLMGLPVKVSQNGQRHLYYPMSQRLWRDKEVIEGLIGMFVASGLHDFGHGKIAGGMADLEARLEYMPYAHRIAKAQLRKSGGQRTLAMKNLEKVVLFRGVGDQSEVVPDGPDEEEEVENGEEDEMGNVKVRRKVRRQKEEGGQYGGRFRRRKDGGVGIAGIGDGEKDAGAVEEGLEELVLADDDIEDIDSD
ncbi:hypothetical protein DRE_00972 [Drechslerella stenobrocha 248]|uniref:Checkpoint protein RAD24-like helical bundle domain-containing protein n=1 Tax=Drechslerella stenobrocha 248 TaxID=1043628 RepID=W7HY88_9PEZI|nr:hypothetical protein DRE_00972 [Drechslerella stenobrocha 248]